MSNTPGMLMSPLFSCICAPCQTQCAHVLTSPGQASSEPGAYVQAVQSCCVVSIAERMQATPEEMGPMQFAAGSHNHDLGRSDWICLPLFAVDCSTQH